MTKKRRADHERYATQKMTSSTWEALFIAGASAGGWIVGQLQAHSLADRKELIWRRRRATVMDRYIARLVHELASRDIPLPEKPEGYDEYEHDIY